MTLNLEAMKSD